ncbi:MAG: DUF4251 domain-containing protein [Fulvivirga sp.]
MKLKSIKRLTIFSVVFVLLTMSPVVAQEAKPETEKSKKEQKKEVLATNLETIKKAAQDSMFIIEANTLRGKNTFSQFVSPNTNFIKLNGNEVIIQTANPFMIGYNGLGGVTVTGKVSQYKLSEDDNGVRILLQMTSAILGHSTLNISVSASGNSNAIVRTGYGGYLQLNGDMKLLQESAYYEGMSIL